MALEIKTDERVPNKFDQYPSEIKLKMEYLRSLIIETANDLGLKEIEETLKWGEPSYITKKGSTLRMDWKEKSPNHYAMYFKCTSKLVPTFRAIFRDTFQYENNRAIIFNLSEEVPVKELKQCIKVTLTYHKVKNEPFLGL
jgi:hypothetical protein